MNIRQYMFQKLLIIQLTNYIKQRNSVISFQTVELREKGAYFINIKQTSIPNAMINLNEKTTLADLQLSPLEIEIIKKKFEDNLEVEKRKEWKYENTVNELAGLY
ncbi:unnamed protein product (macronuclear) [Paramecium tetraurelia]|uniref:Uncharacterized protein n=1 Tax=Paramecium tetraurelia TaxID=5888 RepID=A0DR24_PARTE|nr:uncharacterized protein GSPATT00002892001 [Paramecium tetraurelia]CAK85491.1 unnamed protein product [Paramecium tetraurelia]|eukprot:XP_001452888.1 hypothetical protein (macronuclear) [Paramecium tetraurelia strain d4-2]